MPEHQHWLNNRWNMINQHTRFTWVNSTNFVTSVICFRLMFKTVPKTSHPSACSDYRPISITPILSLLIEKTIVRNCFYPILHNPPFSSLFADQFAFRPIGSSTCALIKLTHELTNMLVDYPYVHVISLDFSKAFDTVRHSSLCTK